MGVFGEWKGTGILEWGFGLLSVPLHSVVLIDLAVKSEILHMFKNSQAKGVEQPERKSMLGPDETRRQRL